MKKSKAIELTITEDAFSKLEKAAIEALKSDASQTKELGKALIAVRDALKERGDLSRWLKKHNVDKNRAMYAIRKVEGKVDAAKKTKKATDEAKALAVVFEDLAAIKKTIRVGNRLPASWHVYAETAHLRAAELKKSVDAWIDAAFAQKIKHQAELTELNRIQAKGREAQAPMLAAAKEAFLKAQAIEKAASEARIAEAAEAEAKRREARNAERALVEAAEREVLEASAAHA